MTKAELIELMSDYPDDTIVVVEGYEGGVNDVRYVEGVNLDLNVNLGVWLYGNHELNIEGDTKAIFIH